PGRNGKSHVIGYATGALTSDTTSQDCCKACIADTNCYQWIFSEGYCYVYHALDDTACLEPTISLSEFNQEGGIIRCNDGSG
ncbi:35370_t:CDS:1, partial [Racocetra persica]